MKAARPGSEGSPAQQCAGLTRQIHYSGRRRSPSLPLRNGRTTAHQPRPICRNRIRLLARALPPPHQRGSRRSPIRGARGWPDRTRRESAVTPKVGFCRLGTMRKHATPETSFRSAAVMAALRTAGLSCADLAHPGRAGGRRGAARLASAPLAAPRRFAVADGQEHVAERRRAVPRATRCRSMIDATVLAGDVQCFEIVWREASLAGAVTTPRSRCGPCSACWTAGWRDAERTL